MTTPADRNYTNARREGRTSPGLIEVRSRSWMPKQPDLRRTPIPAVPSGVPSRQHRRAVAKASGWTVSHLAARKEGWVA